MEALKFRVENHVGVVTFDKPPANLFDYDVYNEFGTLFRQINDMADVHAVILKATGKNFSFGNEVKQLSEICPHNVDEHYRIVGEGLSAIYACTKPTVAAVQGMAVGAGLAAPACCDVILAADDASFFIPEITVGIVGAAEFLQMLVPKKIARYYAYTGKPIPAYKIWQWGGILELVPRNKLEEAAFRIANDILEKSPPLGLSALKQAMNDNENDRLLEKFYRDGVYGKKFIATEDFQETTRAFFEKRKPVYRGR